MTFVPWVRQCAAAPSRLHLEELRPALSRSLSDSLGGGREEKETGTKCAYKMEAFPRLSECLATGGKPSGRADGRPEKQAVRA